MGIIIMSDATCYGLGCLNMQDLYDFIVELKDMDLYHTSRQTCCDGGLITENCECDVDPEDLIPFENTCLFGQCMSWDDWDTIVAWIEGQLADLEQFAFDMVPTLFAAMGYQGLNGGGDTMPEFYNNLAEIGAIISGASSTVYAGSKLLNVALKDEAWAPTSISLGAVFLTYGGSSIVQLVMFLFESLWTIAMFT